MKCTVCPEHKVRSKPYAATLVVDEQEEVVTSVKCHDCPASEGGCKHGVAFLMWLHRRSEEPSCTSIECYWKKSNLAKVGTSTKILSAREMAKRKPKQFAPDGGLMNEFVKECKARKINNCQFIKHEPDYRDSSTILSLHHLMMAYNEENCDRFLLKIFTEFSNTNIKNAERDTRGQNTSYLWHELRYGRITASKCYEVSRCKTIDGTVVAVILGAKIPETSAMFRGRKLEAHVRKVVEKKLGIKIKTCGLYISKTFPMIAASPDGINKKTTFEIKCPVSTKTSENYINKEGRINEKYYAQVQIQMYCTQANESYFCVASSDFDKNNEVTLLKVVYDHKYVMSLLDSVLSFWKNNIFPVLYKSVTNM